MSCEHCLSNSDSKSEQHSASMFLKFAQTISANNKPTFLLLTGGEPLLRADLAYSITDHARRMGSKVGIATGMFFARSKKWPINIRKAIEHVDFCTVSIDRYHEKDVSREYVFHAVNMLLEMGKSVQFQVVVEKNDNSYLTGLLSEIRENFENRVPVFVGKLSSVGRAAHWLGDDSNQLTSKAAEEGCPMASWPVVTYDGSIVACCNQDVVNGPPPRHLLLGHTKTHTWQDIVESFYRSDVIKVIRLIGPGALADHGTCAKNDNYCSRCRSLSSNPMLTQKARHKIQTPFFKALEIIADGINPDIKAYQAPGYESWLISER